MFVRPPASHQQHLRGDAAFSDVYELKEEVGQTATSVRRRCLHRVTAVEYSVKVSDAKSKVDFIQPNKMYVRYAKSIANNTL